MLRGLARVSSVSGGSITAGLLGLRWKSLTWDANDRSSNLDELVVQPIMKFAEHSIDVRSFLAGILTPRKTVSDYVAGQYDRHLFHGATLQDLPDAGQGPRFVINSTNVQTGKLVRFSRPYMADYTIGLWRNPTTSVADAVAASSSFPPVLSPHRIKPSGVFDAGDAKPIHGAEFRKELVLTDGGVYDNLGQPMSPGSRSRRSPIRSLRTCWPGRPPQVANRPVSVVIGVNIDGESDRSTACMRRC
jgi:NTE family protein